MIQAYMCEQVFSTDDKRHLSVIRNDKPERATLCGLPSGKVTGRVHPCNCIKCRELVEE